MKPSTNLFPLPSHDRDDEPSAVQRRSEIVRKSRHLAQLDPARGVAILLVIVFHASMFTMTRSLKVAPTPSGVFYRITGLGWMGVDLFFVLSGFLITRILVRSKGHPSALKNFYARRTLRIFPLYFAALGLWTLASQLRLSNAFGATPWLWTYTSNLLIGWRGWPAVPVSVNHFWSLAVEEQFYLVWPFVVMACSRLALLRACAAMLLVSPVARGACVLLGHPDAAGVWPVCRADALLAGAAVALLLGEADVPSPRLQAVARRVLWLCTASALALVSLRRGFWDTKDPLLAVLGFTPIALIMAAILVLLLGARAEMLPSPLARALATVGKYSYGIYVFQQPALLTVSRWQSRLLGPSAGEVTRQVVVVLAGGCLSFACAWLSWHLLEKHAILLKRHFV